jgi:hypothetical protein
MPFEKGQSGNPGGKRREKLTHDALMIELKAAEAKGSDENPRGLRGIVRKVIELAESGERWATEFVRDTIDGKPAQAIIGGDEDDPAINVVNKIVREIVRPQPNNPNG